MTLRTYHEEGFGNPHEDPQVRLYRTADDSWARGQTDPHPGLDEQLTDIHSGFPAGDLVPWDWEIDVNAVDWSTDLADDTLSILMRNEKTEYSYVYWYGSDVSPAPPVLTVVFDGNCLGMEVSTLVAGEMAQWDISNAGGGSSGVVVWGLTLGSTVVNGTFNYCASFGINGVNQNRVVGFWTANGSGDAQVMRRIPGNVSGLTVHTQAAQQGTCPEECMSDVDTQTIG